jgi:hypothetical protein
MIVNLRNIFYLNECVLIRRAKLVENFKLFVLINKYIVTENEREREREKEMYMWWALNVHLICLHFFLYLKS